MIPSFSTRIKRGIAFVIDWNICLLPTILVAAISAFFLENGVNVSVLAALAMLAAGCLSFVCIALRDFIFGGVSVGKRIFDLTVVDSKTLGKLSLTQKLLRGIFFFFYQIDGIVLFVSGKSLGDMAFNTLVLSKKELDAMNEGLAYNTELKPQKKTSTAKILVSVFAICLAFLLALIGVIFAMLESQKDTEEYKLAYDYVVNSETFSELGIDESKLWMNSYSRNTTSSFNGENSTTTVEMGFRANFKAFTVVCHYENGVWSVCDECTGFD